MRDVIMCVRAMLSDWAGIIRDLLTVKLFILSAKAIEWPLVFSLQNCNGTTRCLSDGPHQRGGGTREREGQCIVLLSIALLQVADALKQICSFLPSPLDLECEVMITVSSIKYNITPPTTHQYLTAGVHGWYHRAHCQPVYGPQWRLRGHRTVSLTCWHHQFISISNLIKACHQSPQRN